MKGLGTLERVVIIGGLAVLVVAVAVMFAASRVSPGGIASNKEQPAEEQKELVETEKILGFFSTDLGRRAAEADVLRKEAPFNVMRKVSGVDVMVQGVIACFFEEDGQLVLLDYKTNYTDKRHPERSIDKIKDLYRGQLMLYKEALEDITGKTVKEVYLHLFSAGESVKI